MAHQTGIVLTKLSLVLAAERERAPLRGTGGEVRRGGVQRDAVRAFVAAPAHRGVELPHDGAEGVVEGDPHVAQGALEDVAHEGARTHGPL